jgi:quinol-cytochrome oxidoreductase complex cytochrome b subunit
MIKRVFNSTIAWVDERFPLTTMVQKHLTQYYAPKNFNFWYYFGMLSLVMLVNQLLTGIFLTMNYNPSAEEAFNSVEYIMRDVEYGWLIRYMHSTGASFFFIVVYLHMFRGIIYGSYKKPRICVVNWHANFSVSDGGGFFWIPIALGKYVFMGSTSYYLPFWCDSLDRRRPGSVDSWRL